MLAFSCEPTETISDMLHHDNSQCTSYVIEVIATRLAELLDPTCAAVLNEDSGYSAELSDAKPHCPHNPSDVMVSFSSSQESMTRTVLTQRPALNAAGLPEHGRTILLLTSRLTGARSTLV